MAQSHADALRQELASAIHDPAVNRTIGDLGIIRDVTLEQDRLHVRLRPCTPDCWPLAMAGIARSIRRYAEARGLTAEVEVEPVMLLPTSDLDAMVDAVERSPEQLHGLWHRSLTVSLLAIVANLQAHDYAPDAICALTVSDLPDLVSAGALSREAVDRYLHWRRELGLPEPGPLLIDIDGQPIDDLRRWQRRARLALLSQHTYAAICRDTRDAYHASEHPSSPTSVPPDGR